MKGRSFRVTAKDSGFYDQRGFEAPHEKEKRQRRVGLSPEFTTGEEWDLYLVFLDEPGTAYGFYNSEVKALGRTR